MSDIDCLVKGTGVIGLACAALMAHDGNGMALVEQECRAGDHTCSRNSEVTPTSTPPALTPCPAIVRHVARLLD